MSPIEVQERLTIAKAMTEQEKRLFLQAMPTELLHEELYRRDLEHEQTLTTIKNILNS